ncbi:uncharacterized protein LOC119162323 [Rhipicephalus microplus]|uniref:uncharacterized protein LOC119162323 n=1 Tax=Rhipicephalus microplus TaxID=6941 RepID=UPI003F6C8FEA
MVQKQHGELLHGLIGRFRSNAAKGNAPLVSSPFSEYESLKLFDDKLTGQMKDTLVEELANKGGSNAAACTKRILSYLLCDNLAAQFSWFGKKGKHQFSQLRLASCIISAVQKVHPADEFTIEAAVREWLRHAPARHRNAARGSTVCDQ